ncbi:MAG TPA: alpha/beta hydrolase [Candidatus Limiplasma sp.]|nr:alpha/beta hydrolase [Candidatus Limiplasma sp.]HPS80565.1 alpha/beta hydrolase [Candidatus Limiplasma sp.]
MQKHLERRPHFLFIFLMLLVYLPVFFCLAVLRARWFGWAMAALSFWMLFWMHGRPFWHGWRILVFSISAYLVVFVGMYIARPDWEVSLPSQIGSGIVRTFTSLPKNEQDFGKSILMDSDWTPPDGYACKVVNLSHAKLELLYPTDGNSVHALLQLHGGAFIAGLNDLYRKFAVRYSQLYDNCLVATLDYRLAPQYAYPAQQTDAMDAWLYLRDSLSYPADRIVVAGDSAGGNLALSLGLRLRDAGEALPAGFVCMSPWADLSNSGASHVYNATVDPSFGIAAADFHGQPVGVDSDYTAGLDATDPYLSPSFGDYHDFPPMLLQAGSIEVLLSDSEMVYENARDYGVDCTLTVYKGMFHVFQGAMDLLPESASAWEEVGRFLAKLAK